MILDHTHRRVHPLGDDVRRDALISLPGNRSRSHLVGRPRRRALTGMGVIDVLAHLGVLAVRAVLVMTRDRRQVDPRPDAVRRGPPLLAREQRLAAVLVVNVAVAVFLDVSVENVAHDVLQADDSFAVAAVLERRPLVGRVLELKRPGVAVVMMEIERPKAAEPTADVPRDRQKGVPAGMKPLVVFLECVEEPARAISPKPRLVDLVAPADVGRVNLFSNPFLDDLDPFAVFEEVLERAELLVEGDCFHPLLPPVGLVGLDVPAVEVVDRGDPLGLAPLDEVFEPIVIRRDRRLGFIDSQVGEPPFKGLPRREVRRAITTAAVVRRGDSNTVTRVGWGM